MEAGMLVQDWTVPEVWVSEHDGVRSTYAAELWGRLRLVNRTFGFEHGFLSGSCARLFHVSSRPRPGVRVPPTRPYPLERYPVVEAVGFRPCLDQHLDACVLSTRFEQKGVVPLFRTSSPRPPAPGSVGIVAGSSSRATV